MLLTLFSPISRNTWEVSEPAKSAKPVAHVTVRAGRCSTKITKDVMNREELKSISLFMQEHERS